MATENADQLVLIVARSHLILSTDAAKERKRKDKVTIPQKEKYEFDFTENEFMMKVTLCIVCVLY